MPSFDVVSELDKHEVTNAIDNAMKELDRRYDLRGKGDFEFREKDLTVTITADAEFQLEQMLEILKMNLTKRKIDIKCMEIKPHFASGKQVKQDVVLREGIDKEMAKKIVALVKESKIKVQAAIQGEQVRITGKKRDDLQQTMAMLKGTSLDLPLQFNNFRD
ncbi:YajQ family cyclic di-GMP-binding protein [Pseudomonas sp. gcc21]|uniref:YajQ family cyclic di-GMP-binding protein n=1 Tax=Pseudomonas sp. gcc21 TaxID=2726989 RepID=UPI001451C630|nr:YajQ family cyclic di-GMP-binding protein [Pseudomonas sp. gcc21]QJD60647.1 YajQ family cyclic di-GMP-binding protein [Pseudomonas sp. gcc21]